MTDLYKMSLGERAKDDQTDMSIVRVPGGWIFIDNSHSQCFVPFNKEFMDVNRRLEKATRTKQLKKIKKKEDKIIEDADEPLHLISKKRRKALLRD